MSMDVDIASSRSPWYVIVVVIAALIALLEVQTTIRNAVKAGYDKEIHAHRAELQRATDSALETLRSANGLALEARRTLVATEREAPEKISGLLSHAGAYPNMAEDDQAPLLLQRSMTSAKIRALAVDCGAEAALSAWHSFR